MALIWTGASKCGCFFFPDRMENIRHDAPADANMAVYTADGLAIFGRVVPGATKEWIHTLKPEWKWV